MNPTAGFEHRDTCSQPPLRSSDDIFDRSRIRWRCPECGRSTYTSKDPR